MRFYYGLPMATPRVRIQVGFEVWRGAHTFWMRRVSGVYKGEGCAREEGEARGQWVQGEGASSVEGQYWGGWGAKGRTPAEKRVGGLHILRSRRAAHNICIEEECLPGAHPARYLSTNYPDFSPRFTL